MFTNENIQQFTEKGLNVEQVEQQLKALKNGFPFLKLHAAASAKQGVLLVTEENKKQWLSVWNAYKQEQHTIMKFVPASGAASRMFKDLFEFLNADYTEPKTAFEQTFCQNIKRFAFRHELCGKCKQNEGKNVKALLEARDYKTLVKNLLSENGLNYGNLPKGLLLFYEYENGVRTAMEEHLVEGALYATCKNKVNLHFTVSQDHLDLFQKKVEEKVKTYEKMFNVQYNITFSEQKPSTDTIAANLDGTPFYDEKGKLLFRPGGHGALIENLNDLDADVVFIKNIDNVVPDNKKGDTVEYKNLLAGVLVQTQQQVFRYLKMLEKGDLKREELERILMYLETQLCCYKEGVNKLCDSDLSSYLVEKLNRPIRVCGVVKNVGEPGGGPFLAYNPDNSVSLQILESSQIDKNNASYVAMFKESTHFNPVDLVCGLKDYKDNKFNLTSYVDPNTGFVSLKSKNGKELKALELPGLWNGAMSNWNTICVEVPLSTFNPVKTVNDLLKMSE